jgi:hypothetical protein
MDFFCDNIDIVHTITLVYFSYTQLAGICMGYLSKQSIILISGPFREHNKITLNIKNQDSKF